MFAVTSLLSVSSALRRLRFWVAAAVLGASASAWAVPTTYTGQGLVGPVTPISPSGSAVFVAEGDYLITGLGAFDLVSSFVFNVVSGTGTGGFEFGQGSNSFSGTIATRQAPVAAGPGFEISYAITGGTGVFLGATGSGNGLIRLVSDPTGAPPFAFIEAGIMSVSVVPEPATGLLMLGGAAALFGRRWLKKA
jgi:hypothetical protein